MLKGVEYNIIRPPRTVPKESELDLRGFLKNFNYIQEEIVLKNVKNVQLYCSFFHPENDENPFKTLVYLHGNAGNRTDAFGMLDFLAYHKLSLFCYDSTGCGQSEGEFISLG